MSDVLKISRNEFKKFFKGKIFILEILMIVGLCVLGSRAYGEMADIASQNLPKAASYSADLKAALIHLDGGTFSQLFLTDFIYKSYFSFFLLFVVLITANTFSFDRESGNMKFTLLTGISRTKVCVGKHLFIAIVSLATLLFNLFLSLVIGVISFGYPASSKGLGELPAVTLLALFPALAIRVIISLLAQLKIAAQALVGLGIVLALLLGIADTVSASWRRFSPPGALSLFGDSVPTLNYDLLTCALTSAIYAGIGLFFLLKITAHYEYYE